MVVVVVVCRGSEEPEVGSRRQEVEGGEREVTE